MVFHLLEQTVEVEKNWPNTRSANSYQRCTEVFRILKEEKISSYVNICTNCVMLSTRQLDNQASYHDYHAFSLCQITLID